MLARVLKEVLLCLVCLSAAVAAAPLRPNIIWIMADDLGLGEIGPFPSTSLHGKIATKNLDQFAKEGMVFRQAYAGYTVCAPSRTTLFTGRHSGKFKEAKLSGTTLAPDEAVTTSDLLQKVGYKTALVGKSAPLTEPLSQGFDYFIGQVDQSTCHNMYPQYIDQGRGIRNVPLPLNQKNPRSREACMAHPDQYNYTVDITQNYALRWIRNHAAGSFFSPRDDPFFMYMSFTIPHAGGWGSAPKDPEQGAPVPTDFQYANETWPDVEKDHAAVIVYLDNYVGQLLEELKALEIDNNTIIFFASDNGAHLEGGHSIEFFNSTGGLLGHKRSLYEGGVRSPTMVRWPSMISPGSMSEHEWAFWDVMPTLCELAGCTSTVPTNTDGISIVDTLLGKPEKQEKHEYLYFTWNQKQPWPPKNLESKSSRSGYSIRSGEWKGVVDECGESMVPNMSDAMQLYHLSNDPFETTDVSRRYEDRLVWLKSLAIKAKVTCDCYQC